MPLSPRGYSGRACVVRKKDIGSYKGMDRAGWGCDLK